MSDRNYWFLLGVAAGLLLANYVIRLALLAEADPIPVYQFPRRPRRPIAADDEFSPAG